MTANPEIDSILQRGADGGRITPEEALLLYTDAPFHALGEAADAVRRRRYPDGIVTYLIDRNINYTNVCVTACKFCAFYRAPKHAEGWSHPMEEILRRCGEAVDLGATQVMLQGGHHPDYGVEYYEHLFSAVKQAYPQLAIHSIGPSEILHMARVSGVSDRGGGAADQGGRPGLDRRRRRGDAAGPAAQGDRAAQGDAARAGSRSWPSRTATGCPRPPP